MQFQKKPYKRNDRLNKQIKIIASNYLLRDFNVEGRGVITITRVKVTNDLSKATIFFSVIDNDLPTPELENELNKKANFFKGILGRKITSKKIPNIIFSFDDSIEFYDKMDQIFSKINNE